MDQLLEQFFTYLKTKFELSSALIDQLKQYIKQENFPNKNHCLLKLGELSTKMYFINAGSMRAEVQKMIDGEMTLQASRFMMENEIIFNVGSFTMGIPSTEAIYTIEPLISLSITRDEFQLIGEACPELYKLAWELSQASMLVANGRIAALKDLDVEGQIRWLIRHEPEWMMRVPDKHLASFISTTPENFSRIKRKLRDGKNGNRLSGAA